MGSQHYPISHGHWTVRLVKASIALSAAALVFMMLGRLTALTSASWIGAKLAPVVAMTRGYNLYQSPDTGVLTGWIYGPIGALILLPSALGKDPTSARLIGNAICTLSLFGPAAYLLLLSARQKSAFELAGAAFVLFGWVVVFSEDLVRCAFLASADAPALGLAALACAAIYRARNVQTMLLSAVAAIMCVWTKQTFLPLLAGLVVWIAVVDGRRIAGIYASLLAGIGLIVSAALVYWFGGANMYFHMITLPASHPLRDVENGLTLVILNTAAAVLFNCCIGLAFLWGTVLLDSLLRERAQSIRNWIIRRRWSMLLIASLSLLPTSVLSYAKFGGFVNNLAAVDYFLLLAALAGLIETCNSVSERRVAVNGEARSIVTRVLIAVGLLLAVACICSPNNGAKMIWPSLVHPYDNSEQKAFVYARAHPQETYFPWNPLISLLAEDRLYHFEWGLIDRMYAKRVPSTEQYVRHLPRQINKIVYTRTPESTATLDTIFNFKRQIQVPELLGCIVYVP